MYWPRPQTPPSVEINQEREGPGDKANVYCNEKSLLHFPVCYFLFLYCSKTVAKEHASTSGDYFRLLAKLLNYAHLSNIPIQGVDKLLEVELKWLLKVRVC